MPSISAMTTNITMIMRSGLQASPTRFSLMPSMKPKGIYPLKNDVVFLALRGPKAKPLHFVAVTANPNDNLIPEINDLSVSRFTLGILGFDESNLPRIVGILLGFLLVLNHILTQSPVSAAQLRSESVGFFLAVIAAGLPYFGKRLKGTRVGRQKDIPADCRQVFLILKNLSDVDKEDLAWGSYAVLQNTVSMSLLIYHSKVLCARGCWNIQAETSKDDMFTLLECEIERMGLSHVMTTLYLPNNADRQGWAIVPKGASSMLLQPFNLRVQSKGNIMHSGGFILLLSSIPQAYGNKEKAWAAALANKFEKDWEVA